MNRLSTLAVATMSLLLAGNAHGEEEAQQRSDGDRVNTAGQVFIAAIAARDISAMDKVWAHEVLRNVHWPAQHNSGGWLGRRQEGLGNALGQVRPSHYLIGGIARSY